MASATRQRLLQAGMAMLLKHGYNNLGINALLAETGVPRGSFYHHFASKEDFALQAVDLYMEEVHRGLDMCLGDETLPPLQRARHFFEVSRDKYRSEGYLGCLLGGLGQELSGVSEVFRQCIEQCFAGIVERLALCLEQARQLGEIPVDARPWDMANLLLNCWEGAALRCRLWRAPAPLDDMLDFYFATVSGVKTR